MPTALYHQSLSLQQFTAFQNVTFDFVPGMNVFVGENGSGKTHVMKALYGMHLSWLPVEKMFSAILEDLFQVRDVQSIIRLGNDENMIADIKGVYNHEVWHYSIQANGYAQKSDIPRTKRSVFIPAIDMMGHTKGFTEAYDEIRLDFDLTCRDIVNLLRLESRSGQEMLANENPVWSKSLLDILEGEIEHDHDGRFYLVTAFGRQPMPLVAEGLRKIATLIQLQKNGWITSGTTLFWDEPEVNLNPILMGEIVSALLALTHQGVQVFLTTHSYVILKELDIQASREDAVRFFAFQRNDEGTEVNPTDSFSLLSPNPILKQYESLYDRELTRSTGRNRQGERTG